MEASVKCKECGEVMDESLGTPLTDRSPCPSCGSKRRSYDVDAVGAIALPLPVVFGIATVWLSYSFAPEWFADALHEARAGGDHHARRREILFSVCCAESYILEWVRDQVLNRQFDRLNKYFHPENGELYPISGKIFQKNFMQTD
jgi:rubredoxin